MAWLLLCMFVLDVVLSFVGQSSRASSSWCGGDGNREVGGSTTWVSDGGGVCLNFSVLVSDSDDVLLCGLDEFASIP